MPASRCIFTAFEVNEAIYRSLYNKMPESKFSISEIFVQDFTETIMKQEEFDARVAELFEEHARLTERMDIIMYC